MTRSIMGWYSSSASTWPNVRTFRTVHTATAVHGVSRARGHVTRRVFDARVRGVTQATVTVTRVTVVPTATQGH